MVIIATLRSQGNLWLRRYKVNCYTLAVNLIQEYWLFDWLLTYLVHWLLDWLLCFCCLFLLLFMFCYSSSSRCFHPGEKENFVKLIIGRQLNSGFTYRNGRRDLILTKSSHGRSIQKWPFSILTSFFARNRKLFLWIPVIFGSASALGIYLSIEQSERRRIIVTAKGIHRFLR